MAEIRLQIPDHLVEELQSKLGSQVKVTDMAKDAMSLFNWAVGERAKGRVILSSSEDGDSFRQITTPSLESIKAK